MTETPDLTAPSAAATDVDLPQVSVSFALPDAEVPVYALALLAEGVLGDTVDLFDVRELGSAQLARVGPHNRVTLQNGRERIACTAAPGQLSRTAPAPLPDLLTHSALAELLALLRTTHPEWALSLRTAARPEPWEGSSAMRWRQGWVAEIALQPDPLLPALPSVAGFHASPEIAVITAALDMAHRHDDGARFARAVSHLESLLLNAVARAEIKH